MADARLDECRGVDERIQVHARRDAGHEVGEHGADPGVDVAVFGDALTRRRVSIKVALLDQRVLAGVGNIYAAEALWLARIDPRAVASSLTRSRQVRLLRVCASQMVPSK